MRMRAQNGVVMVNGAVQMDEIDYFSRQRSIPDWYQPLIEAQTTLVLGVGGIGCSVARNLW